jgi:hypothetical protein
MPNKLQLYKEEVLKEFDHLHENQTLHEVIRVFISQALDSQLALIRENVPEEKDETDPYDYGSKGFNDCRNQLLAFLESDHE